MYMKYPFKWDIYMKYSVYMKEANPQRQNAVVARGSVYMCVG